MRPCASKWQCFPSQGFCPSLRGCCSQLTAHRCPCGTIPDKPGHLRFGFLYTFPSHQGQQLRTSAPSGCGPMAPPGLEAARGSSAGPAPHSQALPAWSRSPHVLHPLSVTPWGPPAPRRAAGCPPRAPADSSKPGLPRLSFNINFFPFLAPLSPSLPPVLAWLIQQVGVQPHPNPAPRLGPPKLQPQPPPGLTSPHPNLPKSPFAPLSPPAHLCAVNPQRGAAAAAGAGERWPGARSDASCPHSTFLPRHRQGGDNPGSGVKPQNEGARGVFVPSGATCPRGQTASFNTF